MSTIIPRWEWRTFGEDLGAAASRLRALEPTGVQASDEVYLLSAVCDANVKIRDDLMDIKQLEQVDGEGLEQWRPVLKAGFPLPAGTVARVFEALGLPVPLLQRLEYSLAQMTAELVDAEPRLRALGVHKTRTRYRVGGCSSELTEVVADGRTIATLAVESEDAAAVVAAVRGLGLGGVRNQSYPRGLKSLIGMRASGDSPGSQGSQRRYAVIDVGTNSVKFHIGEQDAAGRWRRVLDRAEVTRLGEGMRATGEIGPQAEARTVAAIADMVEEARRKGAREVVAVGTMGMRNARNSQAFIEAVRDACGIAIEVIGGEEEARLAYRAVQDSLGIPGGRVVVFDTGGGSTQVTLGEDGEVLDRFSLNLGAVRLTEQFGLGRAVSQDRLDAAHVAIDTELGRLDTLQRPNALVGMGGAVTNLAAVALSMSEYDPDRIQGAVLTRAEVQRQIAEYAARDAAERRSIPGLQPGRAEVILAGALIVLTLMDKVGLQQLSISDRGLRHGVLLERFSA